MRERNAYCYKTIQIICVECGARTAPVIVDCPKLNPINSEPDESTRYTKDQAIAIAIEHWNARVTSEVSFVNSVNFSTKQYLRGMETIKKFTNWIDLFEYYKEIRNALSRHIDALEELDSNSSDFKIVVEKADVEEAYIKLIEDLLKNYIDWGATAKDIKRQSDEQLFLKLRYVQDLTIDETAEAMFISRDTAYRIRRRITRRPIMLKKGNQ